jgi:hypothetical protein
VLLPTETHTGTTPARGFNALAATTNGLVEPEPHGCETSAFPGREAPLVERSGLAARFGRPRPHPDHTVTAQSRDSTLAQPSDPTANCAPASSVGRRAGTPAPELHFVLSETGCPSRGVTHRDPSQWWPPEVGTRHIRPPSVDDFQLHRATDLATGNEPDLAAALYDGDDLALRARPSQRDLAIRSAQDCPWSCDRDHRGHFVAERN